MKQSELAAKLQNKIASKPDLPGAHGIPPKPKQAVSMLTEDGAPITGQDFQLGFLQNLAQLHEELASLTESGAKAPSQLYGALHLLRYLQVFMPQALKEYRDAFAAPLADSRDALIAEISFPAKDENAFGLTEAEMKLLDEAF